MFRRETDKHIHTHLHTHTHTHTPRVLMVGTGTEKHKQDSMYTYIHIYIHTYIHTYANLFASVCVCASSARARLHGDASSALQSEQLQRRIHTCIHATCIHATCIHATCQCFLHEFSTNDWEWSEQFFAPQFVQKAVESLVKRHPVTVESLVKRHPVTPQVAE
jgi:hypothetical protein